MKSELNESNIIKQERVGYLKSKFNLMQGSLYLMNDRLILQANKANMGAALGGILGALVGSLVAKKDYVFDMPFSEIDRVEKGKHGRAPLIEITNKAGESFKITTKNVDDWEYEIKMKM